MFFVLNEEELKDSDNIFLLIHHAFSVCKLFPRASTIPSISICFYVFVVDDAIIGDAIVDDVCVLIQLLLMMFVDNAIVEDVC